MRFTLYVAPLALIACPPSLYAEETPAQPLWAFEDSDIPVDPAFRFGVLDNGLRYVVRENGTPEGTVLVRLHIGSGSLDESDSEQGLAHFLEHMAFNGSARIPEGEMVKLLEREGLSFGADTNATTSFESTVYKLNLPRNDLGLLDTALMLMRETASELTLAPEAVDRERGVVLAERRDRRNFAYKELEDQLAFNSPDARHIQRLPAGTVEILENATAQDLRGFYTRTYVPENAVVMVVGDLPADQMEQKIRQWFADWSGGADPVEPEAGPVDITRSGETDIYLDPALPERITISRQGPWQDRPDSVTTRQQNLLRQIGYDIVNRRLARLARGENAPFKGAGFGTSDVFEDARATNLVVDSADGEWQRALMTAGTELRRALAFGFSDAELAEQVAKLRNSMQNAVRGADTRDNGALIEAITALVDADQIPSTSQSSLQRFEAFAPQITPAAVLAALQGDITALDDPLIRFEGRLKPSGGADALRAAWNDVESAEITPPDHAEAAKFAYQDFGDPGAIISDTRDPQFGFRLIRFANGVMLNLKQTDISKDRISFRATLDGGDLLQTRDAPLKTVLTSSLPNGGLGAHSQDDLDSILAGRNVRFAISSTEEGFRMSGTTTPADLQLQLQVLAAALTDPGYRPEGVERFRRSLDNFFARLDATPSAALGNQIGGILSDGDPRFTLQSQAAYEALTFEQLRTDISDRLANGALELALVGDFDEQAAIDAVAATLGALPVREAQFRPYTDERQRSFTATRGTRTLTHRGEPDQALVYLTWPTRDDSDLAEALKLGLLARVVRLELQDILREELGEAYSPSANSGPSKAWPGYGVFAISAQVDQQQVETVRAAIQHMLGQLRSAPLDPDILDRARQPLLEDYDNLLKTLGGWMTLVDRAQSEADRLHRYSDAPDLIRQITPQDMMAMANRYLAPADAVELLVLPAGETTPK